MAVWSDNTTIFNGSILATGGANFGDGGTVETSGHENLIVNGDVDTAAPHGVVGTWLMDPLNNITISQSSCTGTGCLNANTLGTDLATTNETITGNGSITLSGNITDSGSGNTTLEFQAGTDIVTTGFIKESGTGVLNVLFDANTGGSGGAISIAGNITTGGGGITLGGGNGTISAGSGFAVGDSNYAAGVTITSVLNAGSGGIIINGQGYAGTAGNQYGVYINGGTVEVTGSGNINITGTGGGGSSDSTGNDDGVYLIDAVVETTSTGNIAITGNGGDAGGNGSLNMGVELTDNAVGSTIESTLSTTGGGSITITATGGTGSGGGNYGLDETGGAYISKITTVTGNIVIYGNGSGSSGGGNDYGIYIVGNVTTTGTGNIFLSGNGSANDSGGEDYGIYVNSGTIKTSGAGNISISGTGGGSSSDATGTDYGVYIYGNSGNATVETTSTGSISIYGTGGDSGGNGSTNQGVCLSVNNANTIVKSTDATGNTSQGSITIQGTAGTGSGGDTTGVKISPGVQITSVDGNISITGNSSTTAGGQDYGVVIEDDAATIAVQTTGLGSITITGTSTDNDSMDVVSGIFSATGSGNVSLTAGSGSTGQIYLSGANISTVGGIIAITGGTGGLYADNGYGNSTVGNGNTTGNITLIQDTVTLSHIAFDTSGNITIEPYTANTTMGVNNAGSTLNLTTAEEGYFTWGKTLYLGGNSNATATTNNITLKSGTALNSGNVTLISTGNITVAAAVTKASGAADTLTLEAANNIIDNSSSAITTSGNAVAMIFDADTGGTTGYISIASNLTSGGGSITLGGDETNPANIAAGTGYAVGASSSGTQYGIYLNKITVNSGGGNIVMNGEGGAYSSGTDYGIYIHGTTVETTSSNASNSAAITLTGEGGNSGSSSAGNDGIYMDKNTNTSAITTGTSGSGTITLVGIMGSSTSGSNYGFASDANTNAINNATGTSNLVLQWDSWSPGANTTLQTAGNILLEPYSANTTVGVAGGGGTLNISTTYLGYLTYGSLTVGNPLLNDGLAMNVNNYAWTTPLTLNSGAGNITIANGSGTLSFSHALIINTTTGNVLLQATTDIVESGGGNITTQDGNIVLDANSGGGTSGAISLGNNTFSANGGTIDLGGGSLSSGLTTGSAYGDSSYTSGILLNGTTLNAGSGNITLTGHAYTSGTNTGSTGGVYVTSSSTVGSTIEATGNGTINVIGTGGGSGSGSYNFGVVIDAYNVGTSTTGPAPEISSVNGNITLTGTAGATTGGYNTGVYIGYGATVAASGNGSIIMNGTGKGSGGFNDGVEIDGTAQSSNSVNTTVSVVNGNLSITGNASTSDTSGIDLGVDIQGASSTIFPTAKTTGNGTITLTGTGGGNSADATGEDFGVYIGTSYGGTAGFSLVESTATGGGAITINGTGGDSGGSGEFSPGVYVDQVGTRITSVDGNITITGNGSSASGEYMGGAAVAQGASVIGTGNACISITGTSHGTDTASNANAYGVDIEDASTVVSTNNGNLSLAGQGSTASSGNGSYGVMLDGGSGYTVKVTGTGNLTIQGTGGGTGTGGSNYGVYIEGAAPVYATSGVTTIIGIGGSGSGGSNFGFATDSTSGNKIGTSSTTTGNITLIANDMSVGALAVDTTGAITIEPYSTNGTVGVGSGSGNLSVTNASLSDLSSYSSLTIGSSAAGNLDINTSTAFTTPVTFMTGSAGNITLDHQITDTASGATGPAAVVIASGENVVNDVGANVINLTGGSSPRWLVYSTSAADDTADGLTAANNVYGQTYASYAPGNVTQSGNTWIYSQSSAGTIDVTAGNQTITYGQTIPTLTYSCSGSVAGCSDLTGALTSAGGAAGAYPNAGTFTITEGTLTDTGGYTIDFTTGTLTVNKANLTITASNVSGNYGSVSLNGATGFTSNGLESGDTIGSVTLSTNATLSTSGHYNVSGGTPWTITPSAATGGTFSASNYNITYDNATTGLTISPLTITAASGVAANNKVYDSTTAATLAFNSPTLSGVVGDDVVSVNQSTGNGAFANANVGNGKAVTVSGLGLTGTDAADYTLTQPSGLTANITPASLSITAANQNQTYGFGGTSAALGTTGFTTSGLLGSDSVSSLTLSTNATTSTSGNYNAGTWTLTPSAAAGSGLSNYTITYDNASVGLTIVQKSLAITGLSGTNKVYDSTDADPVTGNGTLSGIVQGVGNGGGTSDVVTLNNGSAGFANPNVGNNKTVTFSGYTIGGADAADYTLSQPASSTANITAAGLTITAANQNQTYGFGGTSAALGTTGFTTSGLLGGQTIGSVTLSTNATTSTSGNYNAGTWTITPGAATGGTFNPANYSITYDNAATGLTITPLAIGVASGVTANNKVYDATTSATLAFSAPALSGVIGSDIVSVDQASGSGRLRRCQRRQRQGRHRQRPGAHRP